MTATRTAASAAVEFSRQRRWPPGIHRTPALRHGHARRRPDRRPLARRRLRRPGYPHQPAALLQQDRVGGPAFPVAPDLAETHECGRIDPRHRPDVGPAEALGCRRAAPQNGSKSRTPGAKKIAQRAGEFVDPRSKPIKEGHVDVDRRILEVNDDDRRFADQVHVRRGVSVAAPICRQPALLGAPQPCPRRSGTRLFLLMEDQDECRVRERLESSVSMSGCRTAPVPRSRGATGRARGRREITATGAVISTHPAGR